MKSNEASMKSNEASMKSNEAALSNNEAAINRWRLQIIFNQKVAYKSVLDYICIKEILL